MESEYLPFIVESNLIEGIAEHPDNNQVKAFVHFMDLDTIKVRDLVEFVEHFQPNAELRDRPSISNVRIGNHFPPQSSPEVKIQLDNLLLSIEDLAVSPYSAHELYENLHPFTDCNGRSGRALWLWHMKQTCNEMAFRRVLERGFLHSWYYQSLDNSR